VEKQKRLKSRALPEAEEIGLRTSPVTILGELKGWFLTLVSVARYTQSSKWETCDHAALGEEE